ncbi:hypothetical protein ACFX14_033093 [Malus domestica]
MGLTLPFSIKIMRRSHRDYREKLSVVQREADDKGAKFVEAWCVQEPNHQFVFVSRMEEQEMGCHKIHIWDKDGLPKNPYLRWPVGALVG